MRSVRRDFWRRCAIEPFLMLMHNPIDLFVSAFIDSYPCQSGTVSFPCDPWLSADLYGR